MFFLLNELNFYYLMKAVNTYNLYKVIYCHISSLLKKHLRLFFTIFLLFGFNSIFSQVYELEDQNGAWDADTAKNYLFYQKIDTDFTICTSLDILKFKDDDKEYGWDAANPIPDEWDFEILTTNFLDRVDCEECEWEDPIPEKCITYKGSAPEDICIYVKVINKTTDVVIPGLDRVKICYRLTDDFTITQNYFNSCLGTQNFKVNEALDSSTPGQKVCNEYNMKIYLGFADTSTLVWNSDDPNFGYTANSPKFSIELDPGNYNYIITNSCGEDITGGFTITDASSFG